MKIFFILITVISLFSLTGCSTSEGMDITTEVLATNDSENKSNSDIDPSADEAQLVQLSFPEDDYTKDLGERTALTPASEIQITKSGTYELSGNYENNTIIVNVNKDTDDGVVYLVLNNANITSTTSTPINIIECKDIVIVLEGDNTISQGEITTADTDFPSATIYSKADMVITGDGNLTINTLYQDGINSRDDLIIDGGNITITAVEDGIVGKDFLAIREAQITIDAKKDGLKSSNTEDSTKGSLLLSSGDFNITASNDAISSDNALQIDSGNFELSSGESEDIEASKKTIKSANSLIINNGTFHISSYDDGIHSDGVAEINGGEFLLSTGEHAIHANATVTINNGTITIENCFEGIQGTNVHIADGTIDITSEDDGINGRESTGGVTIDGGSISINFGTGTHADGIDSNGFFTQNGGDIVITSNATSNMMQASIDVDGTVTMTGGTAVDEDGNPIEVSSMGKGGRGDKGGMKPEDFDGTMPEDFRNRRNENSEESNTL